MATFVVESYLSRTRAPELDAITARLGNAIAASGQTIDRQAVGPPVRWLRSTFVPEDEVCFHVLEAELEEEVIDVCRAAGITPDRVVRAETLPPVEPTTRQGAPNGLRRDRRR